MHHPPLRSGIDKMDGYGGFDASAALTRLLRRHEQVEVIMAGHIHFWTCLAIARHGTVDDRRVDCLDGLIAKSKPIHNPRTKLLQDNVGFAQKRLQEGELLAVFEVQGKGLFTPIEQVEPNRIAPPFGSVVAHVLPGSGALDLNHLRSGLSQHQAGKRARQQCGKIENLDAGERLVLGHGATFRQR